MIYLLLLIQLISHQLNNASDQNNTVYLTPSDTIKELSLRKIPLQHGACKDYFVRIELEPINNNWHLITTFYNPDTGSSISNLFADSQVKQFDGLVNTSFAVTSLDTCNNIIFKYTTANSNQKHTSLHIVNEKGRHFFSISPILLSAEKITVHPNNEACIFALFKKRKSEGDVVKIKKCDMHPDLQSVDTKTIYRKKGNQIDLLDARYSFSLNPQTNVLQLVFKLNNALYKACYHASTKELNEIEYAPTIIGVRPSLNTLDINDRLELQTIQDKLQNSFSLISSNATTSCNIDPFVTHSAPISANLNIGAMILKGYKGINKCIAFFDPKDMIVQKFAILTGEHHGCSNIYFTGNERFLLMTNNKESFYIDLK